MWSTSRDIFTLALLEVNWISGMKQIDKSDYSRIVAGSIQDRLPRNGVQCVLQKHRRKFLLLLVCQYKMHSESLARSSLRIPGKGKAPTRRLPNARISDTTYCHRQRRLSRWKKWSIYQAVNTLFGMVWDGMDNKRVNDAVAHLKCCRIAL